MPPTSVTSRVVFPLHRSGSVIVRRSSNNRNLKYESHGGKSVLMSSLKWDY